jgi:hypothetical protein
LQTTSPKQPCADFYSAVKKAAGKAKKTSGNMKNKPDDFTRIPLYMVCDERGKYKKSETYTRYYWQRYGN